MANLSRWNEAMSWRNEWLEHGERGARIIKNAAKEQRANLEAVKRHGHSGWCNVAEYEKSVRMLEETAENL